MPVGLVKPLDPVTVMSTVPAAPAGAVAVIDVAVTTVKAVAAVAPNLTVVAPVNPVPVRVTTVPPVMGPLAGLMLVMVGAGVYVNWSAAPVGLVKLLAPVTVTSTVPAAPAGAVAVIDVEVTTVNDVAAVAPNLTAVTPVKSAPVIVTLVPPVTGPVAGLMLAMVGAEVYRNWSAAPVALVRLLAPVTVMSTVPAAPAGAVAVIDVALTTVNDVAAVTLNFTAVAPVKPVPVMVTVVPPVTGPLAGLTLTMAGAAV